MPGYPGERGMIGMSLSGKDGLLGPIGLPGGRGEMGKQGKLGNPGVCDNKHCFTPPPVEGTKGNGKHDNFDDEPSDPRNFNDNFFAGRSL